MRNELGKISTARKQTRGGSKKGAIIFGESKKRRFMKSGPTDPFKRTDRESLLSNYCERRTRR